MYLVQIKTNTNNLIDIGFYKNYVDMNKDVFTYLVNNNYLFNKNVERKNVLNNYNYNINNISTNIFINKIVNHIDNIVDFCKKYSDDYNNKWSLYIKSARIQ